MSMSPLVSQGGSCMHQAPLGVLPCWCSCNARLQGSCVWDQPDKNVRCHHGTPGVVDMQWTSQGVSLAAQQVPCTTAAAAAVPIPCIPRQVHCHALSTTHPPHTHSIASLPPHRPPAALPLSAGPGAGPPAGCSRPHPGPGHGLGGGAATPTTSNTRDKSRSSRSSRSRSRSRSSRKYSNLHCRRCRCFGGSSSSSSRIRRQQGRSRSLCCRQHTRQQAPQTRRAGRQEQACGP